MWEITKIPPTTLEKCKFGIHRPRTKYLDVEKANLTYVKQRKHNKSQQRKITRRLLKLLGKILQEIRKIGREHESEEILTDKEKNVIGIITKVYRQQKKHFGNDNPRESIPERIVSLAKPYVRPIVRGKKGTLCHATDQGKEEENRDPGHLLRHPYRKRSPFGRAAG